MSSKHSVGSCVLSSDTSVVGLLIEISFYCHVHPAVFREMMPSKMLIKHHLKKPIENTLGRGVVVVEAMHEQAVAVMTIYSRRDH